MIIPVARRTQWLPGFLQRCWIYVVLCAVFESVRYDLALSTLSREHIIVQASTIRPHNNNMSVKQNPKRWSGHSSTIEIVHTTIRTIH